MADFLARDAHLPEHEGHALIDQLVSGEPSPPSRSPETTTEREAASGEAGPASEVLESLTRPKADEPSRHADENEPKREDKAEPDRGVIDDLLGGERKS